MRLLLVNPNTTASMTASMARVADAVAARGTEVAAVTSLGLPTGKSGADATPAHKPYAGPLAAFAPVAAA